MGVFKPLFTESNIHDEKRIRVIPDNIEEVGFEDISPEERQQLLNDFQEKLKVAEAQSASGAPRTSLDDAMNKLRKMVNE